MFEDRIDAGKKLANLLLFYKKSPDVVVLAIPRGGVVVAKALSDALILPLKCLITKKLGAPDNPELAIGAVGPGRVKYLDKDLIGKLRIDKKYISREIQNKYQEVKKREKDLGEYNFTQKNKWKTVILVDDGIATGATVIAAALFLRKIGKKIVVAVPVIAKDNFEKISKLVDRLICVEMADDFRAVGQFYKTFSQISDLEVINILRSSKI